MNSMRLKGMTAAAAVFLAAMGAVAAPLDTVKSKPAMSDKIGAAKPGPAKTAPANVAADAVSIYRALLAKECPVKHLEWLSEGELDDLIEVNFHDGLSPALQAKLDAADNDEKRACANTTGGLSCFNGAYMRAMNDVKLLARFARLVCDSGLVCQSAGECGRK